MRNCSGIKDWNQRNTGAIHDHLALFGEIHRDLAADIGLHLSGTPFGVVGVLYPRTGGQKTVQVCHRAGGPLEMNKPHTRAELAELVGSRICHDLISPIGAIANGLELLTMSGTSSGAEMDLIADSAGDAGARISFFRIAYGAAGDQLLASSETRAILAGLTQGSRLTTDWQLGEPQSRHDVRLAFLALQCCETALPYGGTVTFSRDDHWCVTGRAETVNADPDAWDNLDLGLPPRALVASNVQFALLAELTDQEGRPLSADRGKNAVTIRF